MLLNKIWALQSQLTNYFCPQQKLVSKVRDGAKVSKKYDRATTPHRRAEAHTTSDAEDKAILADTHASINPAAVQRRIRRSPAELLEPHHQQGRTEDQGTDRRTLYARILR